ncbi:YdcF family protein [Paenibacillus thermoaerophilus]|uniref:YdcF family protein n=1 Tax=Paenibacillus thermoaerophilus TaxID=1215385 RepID=A0ABW2V101_9BACL|nr:YdcF family protein [Paenibacillus thermoaerophilus]TMV13876.1 YdcF family protein [Paenibacillus thermoaerophilus]
MAKSKRWKRVRRTAALVMALAIAWTTWIQVRICRVEAMPDPERADVGIVLGAALWNDRPSPALRERLDHAVRLYRAGVAENWIVSGGLGNGSIPEAEGMRRYLVEQGVPEERIVMETESTSTYENILYSKRLMELNNWRTAVVVTHSYHGARALNMMRHVGYENPKVSTTDSEVLFEPWHKARETLAFTKWLLQKWTGAAHNERNV